MFRKGSLVNNRGCKYYNIIRWYCIIKKKLNIIKIILIIKIESTFKSVENMSIDDLDPTNVKKKAQELEDKIKNTAI